MSIPEWHEKQHLPGDMNAQFCLMFALGIGENYPAMITGR